MLKKENFEFIGQLGRTHGIAGEISAKLSADIALLWEDSEEYPLFLMLEEDGLLIPYRVEQLRSKGEEIDLIRFSGITTKEQAEALIGREVWLDKEYFGSEEDSSEYLDFEHYTGYQLIDATSGNEVGEITAVDDSTINTLLQVSHPELGEFVLPIADELIQKVDVDSHKLWLHIPEGLLDL